jgi:predicted small lipoprotein YifL
MPVRRLAIVALLAAALTGCGHVGPHRRVVTTTLPPSATPTPQPTHTIVHAFRRYAAGQTAGIEAQTGVSLTVTVSKPAISRTSLSRSHGYPPQHGYYLTFHLDIVDTGSQPVVLSPRDFVVLMPHQGTVTSYDGNSPYSGASRQLDTTELEPGGHDRAPLTFDVRATHGRFDYRPGKKPVAVWTF